MHRSHLLLAVLAAGLCAQGPDLAPLDGIKTQHARAARDEERELWESLLKLGQRCLAAKMPEDDWKALGSPAGKPVLVNADPVPARILTAWTDRLRPLEAGYRVWLVPAPGAVYLVAHPAGGWTDAVGLFDRLEKFLADQPEDDRRIKTDKARLRNLILTGEQKPAWFTAVVRLYPAPGVAPHQGPVRAEVKGGKLVLTPEGRRAVTLAIPDSEQLGFWVGRPFTPPPNAPTGPNNSRIYVALDWSEYLASPQRRQWLLAELQHALKGVEEKSLVDGSVFLHSGSRVAAWRVALLREGKLPEEILRAVQPHTNQTIETLTEVLAQEEPQRATIARLYFLTWNPDTTIPPAVRNLDLKRSSDHASLAAHAGKLQPFVLQMGETRLPCFASLAGKRYYTFPFRANADPTLTLPQWDD
jgi:hypothetical protein